MELFLLVLITILLVESIIRLRLIDRFGAMLTTTRKIKNIILSQRVSDHWKEVVLQRYSVGLFRESFIALVILASMVAFIFVADYFLEPYSIHLIGAFSSFSGIAVSLVVGISYAWVRSLSMQGGDYSTIEKILHYVGLASPSVSEALFDLEQRSCGSRDIDISQEKHVFVTGLARSGSTILLNALHGTGLFSSLSYADMPFVLAPNLWARITRNRSVKLQKKERAHGDGIAVDGHSPEAFEEVFWLTFSKDQYTSDTEIHPYSPDDALIEKYRKYVASITVRHGKRRYLCKNNNNVMRLKAIIRSFPQAILLVPFRSPLHHAQSLLEQDIRFRKKHSTDKFGHNYMNWLGHFEFGGGHKRPQFDNYHYSHTDRNSVDYWLEVWVASYRHVLEEAETLGPSVVFVCYETLCDPEAGVWQKLARHLDVNADTNVEFINKNYAAPLVSDKALCETAADIYNEMVIESDKALSPL